MIRTEEGTTTIQGELSVILADLSMIVYHFKKCLTKNMSKEKAEELIAEAVEDGLKTAEELHNEAAEILKNILPEEVLKKLLKMAAEPTEPEDCVKN